MRSGAHLKPALAFALAGLVAGLLGCGDGSARGGRPGTAAEPRSTAPPAAPASPAGSEAAAAVADSPPAVAPAPTIDAAATLDSLEPLAPPGEPASRFPEPDRPIASITSDHWSNENARDRAGEARRVMELLSIDAGAQVADIGAGSGYYTARLSPVVGSTGRVLATDVTLRYLEGLRDRVRKEDLDNVALGLGDPHDPRLPAASVDVALMVHMYHEIEQPYAFVYNLAPALRPGARVGVVDLDRATSRHGTPLALLRCELEAVGYRRVTVHDLGKGSGYLAVFAPPGADGPTRPETIQVCQA